MRSARVSSDLDLEVGSGNRPSRRSGGLAHGRAWRSRGVDAALRAATAARGSRRGGHHPRATIGRWALGKACSGISKRAATVKPAPAVNFQAERRRPIRASLVLACTPAFGFVRAAAATTAFGSLRSEHRRRAARAACRAVRKAGPGTTPGRRRFSLASASGRTQPRLEPLVRRDERRGSARPGPSRTALRRHRRRRHRALRAARRFQCSTSQGWTAAGSRRVRWSRANTPTTINAVFKHAAVLGRPRPITRSMGWACFGQRDLEGDPNLR
jgi:hypothetical protein